MLTLALAFISIQDPLPVLEGLEYGPETTVITEPRRPDGTIDYVKALNDRYGEGVTPENNSAVAILLTMSNDWLVDEAADWHAAVLDSLRIEPPSDHPTFTRAQYHSAFADPAAADEALEQATVRPWADGEFPAIAAWLRDSQDALEIIATASKKQRFFVPLSFAPDEADKSLIAVWLLHVAHVLDAANAFAARANRSIARNDPESARADIMAILRLSRLLEQEPLVVSSYIGHRLAMTASEIVENVATSESLHAELASDWIADLKLLPPQRSMHDVFDLGERFNALDSIQRVHAEPDYLASLTAKNDQLYLNWVEDHFDVNVALRIANTLMDASCDAAQIQDYPTAHDAIHRVDASYRETVITATTGFSKSIGAGGAAVRSSRREASTLVATILLPAFPKVMTDRWEVLAMDEINLAVLALGGYHAAHGEFLDSLTDLVPEFLDEIPLDRFNEQPLNYHVEGDTATVWSVGPDQQDDGGTDGELDVIATVRRGSRD